MTALAITSSDLAEYLGMAIAGADAATAAAICADASAMVRGACDATLLAAATGDDAQNAKLAMKRYAQRTWTNRQERASYSGPEGLTFAAASSVRILTEDERALIAPLTLPGFG